MERAVHDMATWQAPKTNWNASNYFNYSDFNCIENNINVLISLLQICGYNLNLTIIASRADGSYLDFYDSLNRIEGNILSVYNCYKNAPSGWLTPVTNWTYDMPFSYVDTNRMENNELGLYNMLNSVIQELPYCGQGFEICGFDWYN
jgi:hypothetical protein